MKYKCLVLDHDDTVVASTEAIHFPAFIDYLKKTRPHLVGNYDFDSFINKNFDPGILSLLADEVGMDEEELKEEERFWKEYVRTRIPKAFDGIGELIGRFIGQGGVVAVSSHSLTDYIVRDYRENGLPSPSLIYGWDMAKENRKPSPFTVVDVMEKYGLSKDQVLVVDDLKPGYDMARAAGVDFAAAAWAYRVPAVEEFMRKNADYYFTSVDQLVQMLFSE